MHGRTMFIAGSHAARDWFDDFTKVPAWGDLKNSERYQKTLEESKNQEQVDTVVGHSLGGVRQLRITEELPRHNQEKQDLRGTSDGFTWVRIRKR